MRLQNTSYKSLIFLGLGVEYDLQGIVLTVAYLQGVYSLYFYGDDITTSTKQLHLAPPNRYCSR
jgi:hypothetical protein